MGTPSSTRSARAPRPEGPDATAPSRTPAPGAIDWRVHGALLAVQVIFAGYHVTAKAVLSTLDPFSLVGLRVLLATPILVFLAWKVDRVLPRPGDLAVLASLGFLGVFANQLLFINGLERTAATNASILMPSIPVFAVGWGCCCGSSGSDRCGWPGSCWRLSARW